VCSSDLRSATEAGVQYELAKQWLRADWAEEAMKLIGTDMQIRLQSRFTGLIDKTLDELEDRLDNGDITQMGSRCPIKARDTAQILSTLYDKRALIRGEPTSRVERISTEDRLRNLSKRFEALPVAGNHPAQNELATTSGSTVQIEEKERAVSDSEITQ